MVIPERKNFMQYGRYGRRTEAICRRAFDREFDWVGFNMNRAADRFQHGMKRQAIAIDASYIRKAGNKTAHVGRFWSGCASANKHGLEMLGTGLVDVDINDCMMLRAVQNLNSTELKVMDMTLPQWYLHGLRTYSAEQHKMTDVVNDDAGFSGKPFVDGQKGLGFNLVCCFRSNTILFYSCQAERTGKRGRPKKHGMQIDFLWDTNDFIAKPASQIAQHQNSIYCDKSLFDISYMANIEINFNRADFVQLKTSLALLITIGKIIAIKTHRIILVIPVGFKFLIVCISLKALCVSTDSNSAI